MLTPVGRLQWFMQIVFSMLFKAGVNNFLDFRLFWRRMVSSTLVGNCLVCQDQDMVSSGVV